MPEIWIPLVSLQRTIDTCKVWWKGSKLHGGILHKRTQISKLPKRPSDLLLILWPLKKRKGNIWSKTFTLLLHRGWMQSVKKTNVELLWRNWYSWNQIIGQRFWNTCKKLYLDEFHLAQTQQVKNKKKFNENLLLKHKPLLKVQNFIQQKSSYISI